MFYLVVDYTSIVCFTIAGQHEGNLEVMDSRLPTTDSSSEDKTPFDVECETRENAETDSCPVEPASIQVFKMSQQQCQQHVGLETEEQNILAHQEEYNEKPYNNPGILKSDRKQKPKKKKTANETPEEKQARLEKQRCYSRRSYQRRSPEMREARRKKRAQQRMNETEEERKARQEKYRKQYQSRKLQQQNETEEEQKARRETYRRYYQARKVRQQMNETEEEREARLEKFRKYYQAWHAQQRMNETEEEREARREMYRQYYRARQRRLAQLKNSEPKSAQGGRGRKRLVERTGILESFENGEKASKKPKRLAKLTAEQKIRLCLEHEDVDLEAYSKIKTVPDFNKPLEALEVSASLASNIDVPDTQSEPLDLSVHEAGTKQELTSIAPDLCAEDYHADASKSMESERSMTLEEKWGLRPLFIRLERIDLEHIIKKLKYESPAINLNDKTCHMEKENNEQLTLPDSANVNDGFHLMPPTA